MNDIIESNAFMEILKSVLEDKVTFMLWFLEQSIQKQKELGDDTVNLAAAMWIVAREMGYDFSVRRR